MCVCAGHRCYSLSAIPIDRIDRWKRRFCWWKKSRTMATSSVQIKKQVAFNRQQEGCGPYVLVVDDYPRQHLQQPLLSEGRKEEGGRFPYITQGRVCGGFMTSCWAASPGWRVKRGCVLCCDDDGNRPKQTTAHTAHTSVVCSISTRSVTSEQQQASSTTTSSSV